jgi:hypothetical protein
MVEMVLDLIHHSGRSGHQVHYVAFRNVRPYLRGWRSFDMADRVASKAKKPTKKLPGKSVKGAAVRATGRDRTGELEAECGRLRAELETAGKRIAALEAQQKQLLDRIDWAIDSLRSLRD